MVCQTALASSCFLSRPSILHRTLQYRFSIVFTTKGEFLMRSPLRTSPRFSCLGTILSGLHNPGD